MKLERTPSLPPLYARAALGGLAAAIPGSELLARLPLVPGRSGSGGLPDVELSVDGIVADLDVLADYGRVCGFTLGAALPATFPHVLAFPLQMRLMTGDDFPLPLLGLVHIDNSITQHRPIGNSEAIDLTVRAEDLRAHPKGRALSLIAEARAGGELVWKETGTILSRGGGEGSASVPAATEPVAGDVPASSEWHLADDLGRRYAAASGDRNPIHMHRLSARAFGFPRAIAHGMWSMARCLAQLEGRLPRSFRADARFLKPILLPGTVCFAAVERAAERTAFAIRGSGAGRGGAGAAVHLQGGILPIS